MSSFADDANNGRDGSEERVGKKEDDRSELDSESSPPSPSSSSEGTGSPPVQLSAASIAALQEFARENGFLATNSDSANSNNRNHNSSSKGKKNNSKKVRRGIDGNGSSSDDEGDGDVMSLISKYFEDPNKNDTFDICYKSAVDPSRAVSFTVKGVKRELGQTLDSTGLTIWRASEHLCQYIMDNADLFQGKKVCELGAGLGMVSILLGKLNVASIIVASDGDLDTIDLLNENIEDTLSSDAVQSSMLYWGDLEEFKSKYPFKFDVLLAADVIYEEGQVSPLMDTIVEILDRENPDSKFYIAYARRNVPFDRVLEAARTRGLVGTLLDRGLNNAEPIYSFSFSS